MRVLGINHGHDSSVCLLEDERLVLSIEAEKDSNRRFGRFSPSRLAVALGHVSEVPDVIAIPGWTAEPGRTAGYLGLADEVVTEDQYFGTRVQRYSTSHERAHLMSAYALSPFEQGRPCYALCWEGTIGALYAIESDLSIRRLAVPLSEPGHRYAFLFELADPERSLQSAGDDAVVAGKLMALTAYGEQARCDPQSRSLLRAIMDGFGRTVHTKADMRSSTYFNIGVEHRRLKDAARLVTDAIFARFLAAAREVCTERRPLLVSGGCGLNCEWNLRWLDCGLFDDVFVPPCTNDTGVAIGAAVDAQRRYTGRAKLNWSVYCGETFIDDGADRERFSAEPLDLDAVASMLIADGVIAWVQGRCAMGPRALGDRSLLAAPFKASIRDRLNRIKGREHYRPIAPVAAAEEVCRWFDLRAPSPHMLLVGRSRVAGLAAVTHVDGTARVQTVTPAANAPLHALLRAFGRVSGASVLCNTSLNFPGRGFINRASDLFRFARDTNLDGVVIDNHLYVPRHHHTRNKRIPSEKWTISRSS